MIRETPIYRILCAIHIVFFTSLLCFGTICLSGTILMVPALGASFLIGKDTLYRKLDITDSIIKTYFKISEGFDETFEVFIAKYLDCF